MSAGAPRWKIWAVWICRIIAGATFILSGWSKTVDLRGFALKIGEYLNAWGIDGLLPGGLTALAGGAISIFELCIGVLLLTGSMRRMSAAFGLLMMAFWLPLTVYIAIADPVSDCGCFGDFLVLSNTATLIKNIILTGLLVLCLLWHKSAQSLYRAGLQWLIPVLTAIYGLVVAIIGWHYQPIVDFRPYPVGRPLVDDDEAAKISYIYSKDGEEREFSLDELPDTTWTFVSVKENTAGNSRELAVFDGEDEVTQDVFDPEAKGDMIVLVYPQPGFDDLLRARMANEIYDYATQNGIEMVGLVGTSGDALDQWVELSRPQYEVYSSDSTPLKQLVRGDIGIVYMRDGRVLWKRNFTTLPADLLQLDDPFNSVRIFDDGRVAGWLSGCYVVGLLLLLGISKLTTIKIKPPKSWRRKKQEA